MKAFYFLLLIVFISSCTTDEKNEKVQKLSFKFISRTDQYSLNFYDNDVAILKSLEAGSTESETVNIGKQNRIRLDSFINEVNNKRYIDTVFHLPNLQVGEPYKLIFPSDSTLNVEFRMFDNEPRVVYDFLKWLEELKASFFKHKNNGKKLTPDTLKIVPSR